MQEQTGIYCSVCFAPASGPCVGLLSGRQMTFRHGHPDGVTVEQMTHERAAQQRGNVRPELEPDVIEPNRRIDPQTNTAPARFWTVYREVEARMIDEHGDLRKADRKAFNALLLAECEKRWDAPQREWHVWSELTGEQLQAIAFNNPRLLQRPPE